MKFNSLFAVALIGTALGGYRLGSAHQASIDNRRIAHLSFYLERYTSPYVLNHARYVARITGRPLFQVLTGLHEQEPKS